jgi:ribosomal protein S8
MYNYTLSDFIARINVARRKHLKSIRIKPSKIVLSLLKIFEEIGIIRGYYILEDINEIEVLMKYANSRCVFNNLIVVSKPSRRIYANMLNLRKLKEKYAGEVLILSTSKGFLIDVDCFKERQGGVVLLRVIL